MQQDNQLTQSEIDFLRTSISKMIEELECTQGNYTAAAMVYKKNGIPKGAKIYFKAAAKTNAKRKKLAEIQRKIKRGGLNQVVSGTTVYEIERFRRAWQECHRALSAVDERIFWADGSGIENAVAAIKELGEKAKKYDDLQENSTVELKVNVNTSDVDKAVNQLQGLQAELEGFTKLEQVALELVKQGYAVHTAAYNAKMFIRLCKE